MVTPMPWPLKSLSVSPASANARCRAQERYSALDLRGSPGFDPRRSEGVSPMPTIAALPRILMDVQDCYRLGFISIATRFAKAPLTPAGTVCRPSTHGVDIVSHYGLMECRS